MRLMLPIFGALIVAFAGLILFLFKVGLDNHMAAQSLSSVTVAPAPGWESRPYQTADGEAITDTAFDPEAELGHTTQDLLRLFETTATGRDHSMASTFQNGDELIALSMRFVPHAPPRQGLMERLGYSAPEAAPPDPRSFVATVFGVPFQEHPRQATIPGQPDFEPVNYRRFTAMVGDRTVSDAVEITLLTNSSDAAVIAVMSRLDVQDINGRIETPDPRVSASAGVFTRDPRPSDMPPRPTAPYRAAQLLASGESFDAPWDEALLKVRTGEITTWEELHATYPQIEDMPPAMLEVLDDGSQDNAARYRAAVLRDSDRNWNGHEAHVLSKLSQAGTTQADLEEYLTGEHDVAPELVALIRQLPMIAFPGAAGPAAQSANAPSVRGTAENCTIENGVRRCVVGDN